MNKNIRNTPFYLIVFTIGLILLAVSHWLVAACVVFLIWLVSHVFDTESTSSPSSMKDQLLINNYRDKFVSEAIRKKLDICIAESKGVINFNELISLWGVIGTTEKVFPKKYLGKIIYSMTKLGYGCVPDYHLGQKRLTYNDRCVVYKLNPNQRTERTTSVLQAEVFFKLFSILLGGVPLSHRDIEYVKDCMCSLEVPIGYQNYLVAYVRWLSLKKRAFDPRTKEAVKILPSPLKLKFTQLLLNAVSLNGDFDNHRVEALKKILPSLDGDPALVHSMIHQTLTIENGFFTIEKGERSLGYAIRQAASEPKPSLLDIRKLEALKDQTKEAQKLLADIFILDEEDANLIDAKTYLTLLERLFEREVWQRDEVLGMLEPGAMLGSVLEELNDYAYEKVGDIVVEEDGDNIYVMTEYKEQLI
jgi:hypothetical protein